MECRLSAPLLLSRLKERERAGGSISDGRIDLLPQQQEAFEPVAEVESERHLVVQTDRLAPLLLKEVLARGRLNIPTQLFGVEAAQAD